MAHPRLPSALAAAALAAGSIALCQCASLDPAARFACTAEGTCESAEEMCVAHQCWPASCAGGGSCPPGYSCSASARCVAGMDAGAGVDAATARTDAAEPEADGGPSEPPDAGKPGRDAGGSPDAGVGTCSIGTADYFAGATEPSNPCHVCEPERSTTSWTDAADGTFCLDGRECLTGACFGPSFVSATARPLHSEVFLDLPADAQPGNALVVGLDLWGYDVLPGVLEVGDPKGDPFHLAKAITHSSATDKDHLEIWYAPSVSAGVRRIHVTFDRLTTAQVSLHVDEYSGLDPGAPLAEVAVAEGKGLVPSAGPVTSTAGKQLLYGFFGCSSQCSPGAGFSRQTWTTPNGVDISEDMIVAPGKYLATAAQSGAGIWLAGAATFTTGASSAVPVHVQGLAKVLEVFPLDHVSLPAAGGAGDTLIAAIALAQDAPGPNWPPTLVDGTSLPWTPEPATWNLGSAVALFHRVATDGADVKLDVSFPAPGRGSVHLMRYSRLGDRSAASSNSGSGGSRIDAGAFILSEPSLIFAFGACQGLINEGAPGFAPRHNLGTTMSQDLLQTVASATGTVTPSWTAKSPGTWIGAALAFPYPKP